MVLISFFAFIIGSGQFKPLVSNSLSKSDIKTPEYISYTVNIKRYKYILWYLLLKIFKNFLMIIVFISIHQSLSDPLPQLGDPYSEVSISNEEIIDL
ncbi:MAG: hypothetical protein CM15mP63_1830 [Gammaproteobacteria bacterium]|nr:MAG: hypothetical protein CM15mP63_1830 [Gammaproteobacteria bacterium]